MYCVGSATKKDLMAQRTVKSQGCVAWRQKRQSTLVDMGENTNELGSATANVKSVLVATTQ